MMLPGGHVLPDGTLERTVRFNTPDGRMELAILEIARTDRPKPEKVTGVLSLALAAVGQRPATHEIIGRLPVADRGYLMARLAGIFGRSRIWLTSRCEYCKEPFDFHLDLDTLPVTEAGDDFPFVTVATSVGEIRVRVPTGEDQLAVCMIEDPEQAENALLARCVESGVELASLTVADRERIDKRLGEAGPALPWTASADCPSCGARNSLPVDTTVWLPTAGGELLDDIHRIASAYHWSEDEILRLPRRRRQDYLDRIAHSAMETE